MQWFTVVVLPFRLCIYCFELSPALIWCLLLNHAQATSAMDEYVSTTVTPLIASKYFASFALC